jgi:ElaB/YqjD/DUF883 family membrane-anchored ribosome-binding protein
MKTETAETTAESMASNAGERTKHYVDVGVDALNSATGKARQLGRNVDGCVRDNPWLVAGAAAGVGLLVGFLLGRRSS